MKKNVEVKYRPNLTAAMVVLALLLLKIFVGIPFWFMLGVVLLFSAARVIRHGGTVKEGSKILASLIVAIFLIMMGDAVWQSAFPRSYQKIKVAGAIFDQGLSHLMGDNTQTKARDLFDIRRDKEGKEFIKYYNELLSKGEIKKAADTLAGFNKVWDVDILSEAQKEEPKTNNEESLANPKTCIILNPRPEPYLFQLGAGQETAWLALPECGKYSYSINSPTENFEIIYSDGTRYGGKDVIPEKRDTQFKVFSGIGEPITIKVTKCSN